MNEKFIDEQCKQAIQMSLIQPEEKMQFGAFISAAIEEGIRKTVESIGNSEKEAIAQGRRQALEEAHKSICNLTEHYIEHWTDKSATAGGLLPNNMLISKNDALTAIANLQKK